MSDRVVALRRAVLMAGAVALAAGCHGKTLPAVGAATAPAAPAGRAPQSPASADGAPAFVGRWAVTAATCSRQAWVLTADTLSSPSVLSCSFQGVEPTDAGYMVDSQCMVGKARAAGRLVFRLTGRGQNRALTLSGGPFSEPMALVRCPDAAGQQLQAASGGTTRGG
jgi:hypothetical protein